MNLPQLRYLQFITIRLKNILRHDLEKSISKIASIWLAVNRSVRLRFEQQCYFKLKGDP
jgi:hypothetical protein